MLGSLPGIWGSIIGKVRQKYSSYTMEYPVRSQPAPGSLLVTDSASILRLLIIFLLAGSWFLVYRLG